MTPNTISTEDFDRLRRSMQIGKRIISGETFASLAADAGVSGPRIRQIFYRLLREVASGSAGGKTILPPASHLAYGFGIGVASIRRDAVSWLGRLDEFEAALEKQHYPGAAN